MVLHRNHQSVLSKRNIWTWLQWWGKHLNKQKSFQFINEMKSLLDPPWTENLSRVNPPDVSLVKLYLLSFCFYSVKPAWGARRDHVTETGIVMVMALEEGTGSAAVTAAMTGSSAWTATTVISAKWGTTPFLCAQVNFIKETASNKCSN